MGRKPCCGKGVIRGAWSAREDEILMNYIKVHGEGKWRELPRRAGLRRCGKSCRLRWLNYLRPDIKRGNISEDEEDLIIRLHKLLGNRWTLIAGRLPGRTDNEIKNYWNTILSKRVEGQYKKLKRTSKNLTKTTENQQLHTHEVICPIAVRCRNSKLSLRHQFRNINHTGLTEDKTILLNPSSDDHHNSSEFRMESDVENNMDFDDNCYLVDTNEDYNADMAYGAEFPNLPTERAISTDVRTETWSAVADSFQEDDAWDLEAIASFLITEEI